MNKDKIVHKTILEQVMKKIQEMIASGEYKVGDRLPKESDLAERLGVGRSSVREALKIFNYLGVLDSKTARGTFVSDRSSISKEAMTWSILLGKNDHKDLLEIRAGVELVATLNLAIRYRDAPETCTSFLKELDEQIQIMNSSGKSRIDPVFVNAIFDFHARTIAASENKLFIALFNSLKYFLIEEIAESNALASSKEAIVQQHQELIGAIKSGDLSTAFSAVQKHISVIAQRFGLGERKRNIGAFWLQGSDGSPKS